MSIRKIADNAYFVESYSTQTLVTNTDGVTNDSVLLGDEPEPHQFGPIEQPTPAPDDPESEPAAPAKHSVQPAPE